MNDKSLYLLEEPISTIFGNVRYLKLHEFIKLSRYTVYLSMTPLHYYYELRKNLENVEIEDRKEFLAYLEQVKKLSLFELIHSDANFMSSYQVIINQVMEFNEENTVDAILDNEEYLMTIRGLILDMNYITEEPVSPNPEIQEYYEDRKKLKQKESGNINLSDIITSIVVGTSNSFEQVRNMTVIQIYSIYYRIGAFKNFDQSTLFATVSSEVKIDSWSKNIDLFEKQSLGIDYNEFNKKYSGIFK